MYLQFPTNIFDKDYLIHTSSYHYDNVMNLIFELFSKHIFTNREVELYLYQLLKDTGYGSIEAIPMDQLDVIVSYFIKHRDAYKVNYDEERLTYLLLAALKSGTILLSIDTKLVTELMDPITLNADSVITFFKTNKLEAIKFKSI